MPGEFATLVSENRFDEFFMTLLKNRGTPTDIITPSHPIYKQMEAKGRIKSGEPGMRPFRDVLYDTPTNETVLSRTGTQIKQIDETLIDVATRAEFDWVMFIYNLNIPLYEYNNLSVAGMTQYLRTKLDAVDTGRKNLMVNRLWNGFTHANDKLYGLAEAIRIANTTDPSRGSIGNLGVATFTTWKNQVRAHAAAYKTVGGGGQITANFLPTLRKLYRDCCDNGDGSKPDLIAMNAVGDDFVFDLVSLQKLFRDDKASAELGVSAIGFEGANFYYDPDMPVDNAAEGTYRLINTSTISVEKARGLMNKWGKLERIQGKTGFGVECSDQWTMCYDDLRKNGILYDVRAA